MNNKPMVPVSPTQTSVQPPMTPPKKPIISKLTLIILLAAAIIAAGLLWWLTLNQPTAIDTNQPVTTSNAPKPTPAEPATQEPSSIKCPAGKTAFASASFGMKFCYPSDWGEASVQDAKLAASDTGYRQVVKFADMPLVQVGGVSDDWTTTVGRDGICFDPNNQVPPLSSYNTSWHGQVGSGASLEFATRSIASSAGGYAMTEEVSNILQSGVCMRGYKVINAPHYRVGSAAFYRDFAEASGITTPALHVAEPNVLLSSQMRTDFDALMASLEAY
ncbi:MAG: hypothetical protein WBB39_03315 [Candidatus Saccharimonadales bacterium]